MWVLKCEWLSEYGGICQSVKKYAKYKKELVEYMEKKGYKYSTKYECWVERKDDYYIKYWYTPVKLERIGKKEG